MAAISLALSNFSVVTQPVNASAPASTASRAIPKIVPTLVPRRVVPVPRGAISSGRMLVYLNSFFAMHFLERAQLAIQPGYRSPDAAQRVALAKRCAAEPGPYKARCSIRSRFSEAALRGELRAASRPGQQSIHLAILAGPVWITQMAAQDLAGGVARQRVE